MIATSLFQSIVGMKIVFYAVVTVRILFLSTMLIYSYFNPTAACGFTVSHLSEYSNYYTVAVTFYIVAEKLLINKYSLPLV